MAASLRGGATAPNKKAVLKGVILGSRGSGAGAGTGDVVWQPKPGGCIS